MTISSMIAHLLPLLHQSLLQEAMPPLSQCQIHVFPETLKIIVFFNFQTEPQCCKSNVVLPFATRHNFVNI